MHDEALARYCHQLGWHLDSGLSLLAACRLLSDDAATLRLREASAHTAAQLRAGATAAAALVAGGAFPTRYDAILVAADEAGHLALAFTRLGEALERRAERRRRLWGALGRPLPALLATSALALLLLGHVLPQLERSFRAAGLPRSPMITTVLGWTQDLLTGAPLLIGLGLVLVAIAMITYEVPAGRRSVDRAILGLPGVGPILWLSSVARYTEALSWLLRSGTPLVRALRLAAHTTGNSHLAAQLRTAPRLVARGESITRALARTMSLPRFAMGLVATGERTGSLPAALERASSTAERDLERRIAHATTTLEPFVLLCLGVVLALLGTTVYVPLRAVVSVFR